MKIASKAQLPDIFRWLLSQDHEGVKGVYRTKRGKPASRNVVFTMTHGKEPSGLAIAAFVRDHPELLSPNHDLTIAVGNLAAAEKYFAATSDESRSGCRFVDHDMNRLPADLYTLEQDNASEFKRVIGLRLLLGPVSNVLDVHSTDPESDTAGLVVGGDDAVTNELISVLPLKTVYAGITRIQAVQGTKTRPHGAAYGAMTALEVETGQHNSPTGLLSAVKAFASWGFALGLLRGSRVATPQDQSVYEVTGSYMAPDTSFTVAGPRLLDMYAEVRKGETLLQNAVGEKVTATGDGLLIYGPESLTLTQQDVASEIWFQVKKLRSGVHAVVMPDWANELQA